MTEAATKYLGSLSLQQKERSCFDHMVGERVFWYYPPLNRRGLPLRDMDQNQRKLAHILMERSLSDEAFRQAKQIIEHELVLRPLEVEAGTAGWDRNPELYYRSIFGEPGGDGPWAWRVEGHHVSLHFSVWAIASYPPRRSSWEPIPPR